MTPMQPQDLNKAAERGEPSHVWRAGQERRLKMIMAAAGERLKGRILVDGCGVGAYLGKLSEPDNFTVGLDIEFPRTVDAKEAANRVVCAAGEFLPFSSGQYDLVLNHEVLEHVQDDHQAIREMVRVLKPGGRLVLFCPNRGYPFETHGIYWRGKYSFGNKLFVNYLPRRWRDSLAPHVRVYSRHDLENLFSGLPVKAVTRTVVFGAYDNIIAHFGGAGKILRCVLQFLEKTPLKSLGLSHFWVVEKTTAPEK